MHNLALELQYLGHHVTGSDDEIYDPALSRLASADLLPAEMGWNAERIGINIDTVIVGMHAHLDNPEWNRAKELGINILSFPEYIGRTINATERIVICGSHGKSTTTAMIMHALRYNKKTFDYLLGGLLDGFDTMVRLRGEDIFIAEGDEYLSSREDRTPKMHHYQGTTVVITGIEWDHMNVFPTQQAYRSQFEKLIADTLDRNGQVLWYEEDEQLKALTSSLEDESLIPYRELATTDHGDIIDGSESIRIGVFGKHNMANMGAALEVSLRLGLSRSEFLSAMPSFRGVDRRLQKLSHSPLVFLDYAHAPSKVSATVHAVKNRYRDKEVIAFYELHTYSSLNPEFLPQYAGSMNPAIKAYVFVDKKALEMKRKQMLDQDAIIEAFCHVNMTVIMDRQKLEEVVQKEYSLAKVFLFMTSGTFGNLDLHNFFPIDINQ